MTSASKSEGGSASGLRGRPRGRRLGSRFTGKAVIGVVVIDGIAEVIGQRRAVAREIVAKTQDNVRHMRRARIVHAGDLAGKIVGVGVVGIGVAGRDQLAGVVVAPGDDAHRVVVRIAPGLAGLEAEIVVGKITLSAIAVGDADDLIGGVVLVIDRIADRSEAARAVVGVVRDIADRIGERRQAARKIKVNLRCSAFCPRFLPRFPLLFHCPLNRLRLFAVFPL